MDASLALPRGAGGESYPKGGKAIPVCDVLEQVQE